MANVDSPFGLLPVRHLSGGVIRNSVYQGGIADASTTTIFYGDPVVFSSGRIARAAAGNTLLGVFAGCEYTDANGDRKFSNYYPGGAGITDVDVMVYDDPKLVFKVQSTTGQTPAIGDRGEYADMITYAAGNTTTGKSIIELGALSSTPATFLLLDLYREVDNAFGEHAVLEVAINEHLLG
jgi:hypothetical protein